MRNKNLITTLILISLVGTIIVSALFVRYKILVPKIDQVTAAKELALPVIKKYEHTPLKLESYRDGDAWAICYGHRPAVQGIKATPLECERLLAEDVDKSSKAVSDLVAVPLTVGQRAALISFTMSGRGRLANSDLLEYLNAGDYETAGSEILLWVHADLDRDGVKERLPGLVARRAKEKALWDL